MSEIDIRYDNGMLQITCSEDRMEEGTYVLHTPVTLPKSTLREESTNDYQSYALMNLDKETIERIVKEFREHLGIEMDWGYVAGQPIISWMPRTPEPRTEEDIPICIASGCKEPSREGHQGHYCWEHFHNPELRDE